jgi:hypothetical protein
VPAQTCLVKCRGPVDVFVHRYAPAQTSAHGPAGAGAPTHTHTHTTYKCASKTTILSLFLFRNGHTLRGMPEFASYARANAQHWNLIEELIGQLEELSRDYALPLILVDGKVCTATPL